MSIYHLSYDLKTASTISNEEIAKQLVHFINIFNPSYFTRPVHTTLIFESTVKFQVIKSKFSLKFSKEIYFVLSQVAHISGEDNSRIIDSGNDELMTSFVILNQEIKKK